MAYIEERKNGYLVVWRSAETGRKKSRLVSWKATAPGTLGDGRTKKDACSGAEALRIEMQKKERAYRKPLERVAKHSAEDGYEPLFGDLDLDYVAAGEDGVRFENYVEALIDAGDLTESAKHTYRHTLRNHIKGTPLGRKNIRFIEPGDLEAFWGPASAPR